jgi:hypothetical protein
MLYVVSWYSMYHINEGAVNVSLSSNGEVEMGASGGSPVAKSNSPSGGAESGARGGSRQAASSLPCASPYPSGSAGFASGSSTNNHTATTKPKKGTFNPFGISTLRRRYHCLSLKENGPKCHQLMPSSVSQHRGSVHFNRGKKGDILNEV